MSEKITTRHIKVVRLTYNNFANESAETIVNETIDQLAAEGKRVVSVITDSVGISPQFFIYTIIYE